MPAGMIMPPPRPCSTRNAIKEVADHARPQSAEPSTKSRIEPMYRRLVPKRSAAQPVKGITVASASM
jgi:hypothetical protein